MIKKVVGKELRLAVGTQAPTLVNYDLVVMNLSTQKVRKPILFLHLLSTLDVIHMMKYLPPFVLQVTKPGRGRGDKTRLSLLSQADDKESFIDHSFHVSVSVHARYCPYAST